ncbi:hypothetical protein QN277_002523 [Acacia crassicarpa]|uniref:CLAVATA3/ESR (CLE)-related protein n=1 Tax=Acacia crassicarpa TaxID=499986 RepID=A0AAE1NB69_9FABA|nr:hypothetical protein QN277_002523 [Acacia crassicarpa]
MAASMSSRLFVVVLCIIVFVSMVVVSSEARLLPMSFSTKVDHKKIDSEILLREVTKNLRRSDEYELQKRSMLGQNHEYELQKRSMLGQNGKLERVSPDGPDSQHH